MSECLVKIFTGHRSIDMIGEVINKYYTHTHTHTHIYIYIKRNLRIINNS